METPDIKFLIHYEMCGRPFLRFLMKFPLNDFIMERISKILADSVKKKLAEYHNDIAMAKLLGKHF